MSVYVKYGQYTFDPAPLMSWTRERVRDGQQNALFDKITISCEGTLVNNAADFGSLDELLWAPLESGLNLDNQELIIAHESGCFVSGVYPRIEGLSTESTTWTNLLRYSFAFVYEGEPADESGAVESYSDSWDYSEQDNHTTSVTHGVSAKGINTNPSGIDNGLENAKTYVLGKIGVHNLPVGLPAHIYALYSNNSYIKRLSSEAINVADYSYSITENYIFASGVNSDYVHIVSSDLSVDKDGATTININGEIIGGGDTYLERQDHAGSGWDVEKTSIPLLASGVYVDFGGLKNLNLTPQSKNWRKNFGIVTYAYSFSDKLDDPEASGVIEASYSISNTPPISRFVAIDIPGKVDGSVWQDLRTVSDGSYEISGNVVGETIEAALAYAQILVNRYGGQSIGTSRRVTGNNVRPTYSSNTVDFSVQWQYKGDPGGATLSLGV